MGSKSKMYINIMALHPEVTGSCFLCVLNLPDKNKVKFLVDCGLFQEEKYRSLNEDFPFDPNNIDFALLTHNHTDHIGRCPMLYKKDFQGKTFCSKQTKELLLLALSDCEKVLSDIAERQHTAKLYNEGDVEYSLKNVVGLEFYKKTEITPNISVTLLKNGHLFGAAMILLEITYPGEEPINILFTGDYAPKNVFFTMKNIPQRIKKMRLSVVIESTYGNANSKDIHCNFEEKIKEAMKLKNTAIIPVFSLGRSQEILHQLKDMQNREILDKSIPIYFDGKLAHAYTRLLLKSKLLLLKERKHFLPENLTNVDSDLRPRLLNCDGGKIIVTTSGMGSYGPAQVYLPYFISKEKALVLFTGYTAEEGTLGAKLKDTEKGKFLTINGLVAKKFADVSYCEEFSAHAKGDGLLDLLKEFENLRGVLINHGSTDVKEKFAERVVDEINCQTVGILDREYFFRIDSWGINKTIPTKLK